MAGMGLTVGCCRCVMGGLFSYAIYVKGIEKSSPSISTERPTVETADQAWDILKEAIDSQGMGVRLALVSE